MENKKKLLLVAPVFFGYYKEIIKELELLDYEVDYFCDSANNSSIFKALSRIDKKSVRIPMHYYYKNNVLPEVEKKQYDYVFFIMAMTCSFSPKMIKDLKEKQKNAKFIMYQWDGEKNLPFVKEIHQYFDNIYTFDRVDAMENSIYNFFPLFYIRNYEDIGKEKKDIFKYDLSYVGTAHPQKLYWINKMASELVNVFPKQYIYHFLPSKLKYFYHKLKNKEYKKYSLNYFKYEKLSTDEIMQVFKDSKCVLDAPQAGQNGLTIRTLECLGAKKKLITQNKDIINYDFYCPENILVFDENVNNNNSKFFTSPYKELPEEIYKKYSLREWLKKIIERLGDYCIMKILVTGANGYLGQGVVKKLLDMNVEVIATDFKIDRIDDRAKKISANLFELENPYEYFEKPDVVLHMAWRDGFVHYSDNHIIDLPHHYEFLKKLVEGGIRKVAVMGSMHEVGFWEGAIKEDTPCNPLSLYGISKNALRDMVKMLAKQKNVEYQWLRGYYIVGNSQYGSSIFSKITAAVNEGKKEFPFTMGQNQYDFIDYDDFCMQIAKAICQDSVNGVINICSGKPEKLADRVERFIKENNYDIALQYGAFPDRPYDSKAVWGDSEKINQIMEN